MCCGLVDSITNDDSFKAEFQTKTMDSRFTTGRTLSHDARDLRARAHDVCSTISQGQNGVDISCYRGLSDLQIRAYDAPKWFSYGKTGIWGEASACFRIGQARQILSNFFPCEAARDSQWLRGLCPYIKETVPSRC